MDGLFLELIAVIVACIYGFIKAISYYYQRAYGKREYQLLQSIELRELKCDRNLKELQQKENELNRKIQSFSVESSRREHALTAKEEELSIRESHINEQVRQRFADTVSDLSMREYISDSPVFRSIATDPDTRRLTSALSQNMKLRSPFNISSRILTKGENFYDVTLYSCTCKDFSIHRKPCKHMYRLAAEAGALLAYDTGGLNDRVLSLLQQAEEAQAIIGKSKELQRAAAKDTEAVKKLVSETSQSFPWLASLYADYYHAADEALERRILANHPRASKVQEELKPLRAEKRELRARCKMAEYQLHFYETLFPWLEEFKELSPQDAYSSLTSVSDGEIKDDYDLLRPWLSPDEYHKLPNAEKFQLALDRFQRRTKSNWEIGIEYERYIGYLCEQRGYKVSYSGATMGMEDMGRDLILSRQDQRIIIQCKRWSQEKIIHEKHIFQLFGSCTLCKIQNLLHTVTGVFVTTASLSDTARQCAEHLGILVFEHIPAEDYPVIKCNVSRSGEKIYHLPFDQQYDRVVIDSENGEFYAMTVLEAEHAGFRRAFRHKVT